MTEQDWDRKIQEFLESRGWITLRDEKYWEDAFSHLRKYLPKQFKSLEEAGVLERTLDKRIVSYYETRSSLEESAANMHIRKMAESTENMDPIKNFWDRVYMLEQAKHMAEELYIYPPPEPEMVDAPEEWEQDEDDDLNKLWKLRQEVDKELSEIYEEALYCKTEEELKQFRQSKRIAKAVAAMEPDGGENEGWYGELIAVEYHGKWDDCDSEEYEDEPADEPAAEPESDKGDLAAAYGTTVDEEDDEDEDARQLRLEIFGDLKGYTEGEPLSAEDLSKHRTKAAADDIAEDVSASFKL